MPSPGARRALHLRLRLRIFIIRRRDAPAVDPADLLTEISRAHVPTEALSSLQNVGVALIVMQIATVSIDLRALK